MLFMKYLLTVVGTGLLLAAAGILVYDLVRLMKGRRSRGEFSKSPGDTTEPGPATGEEPSIRWRPAGQLAIAACFLLLTGISVVVVPSGYGGVRVSQVAGIKPGTLYPGVHWVLPLFESVETFSIRDSVYSTSASEDPKKTLEALQVQTKEGLIIGLAVTVRYRLDPARLHTIYANLPQPVEVGIVPPVVASVFREIAPNYTGRELFATRREEIRRMAATAITAKLGADGVIVKEVMLRDIVLPAAYARGLEGLLLSEQQNERLAVELQVKEKLVKAAELEAEADKMREVKRAEARAQVTVLEAKAQADAMQHTLPLKEKQIQQTRLEAEARKEATVKNAEAMAMAKVIDSKAELEKRKLMAESDEHRIRKLAGADAERMKLEAEVLKQNPLLIQKIIAERLSDKVQIMMVPTDGKFFFANDVFKAIPATVTAQ